MNYLKLLFVSVSTSVLLGCSHLPEQHAENQPEEQDTENETVHIFKVEPEVVTHAFSPRFIEYFGEKGAAEVEQALAAMNAVENQEFAVDTYEIRYGLSPRFLEYFGEDGVVEVERALRRLQEIQ